MTIRKAAKAKQKRGRAQPMKVAPLIHAASTETGALTQQQVIAELTKSPHGDYDQYLQVGLKAARDMAAFFAHLLAWNQTNGQIRDAKVALPVIQLATLRGIPLNEKVRVLRENALAHLALQSPRDLVKACKWAKGKLGGHHLGDMVKRYLRTREKNAAWWDRTVLAHRAGMHDLYAMFRVKPSPRAQRILFERDYPSSSVFAVLRDVGKLIAAGQHAEAAGLIVEAKLDYKAVVGVLGKKADPAIGMALIERMSATELVTATKMLEGIGLNTDPAMRAAYQEKLKEVSKSKANTLKAGKAAQVVGGKVGEQLKGAQERAIDNLGKVDGRWLVLGDCSASMGVAIEQARQVASILARVAESVHLVFFNTSPVKVDVTGKTYDEIKAITALVEAGGGTSIGCGLDMVKAMQIEVDGIAIISDAQENSTPWFYRVYQDYCAQIGKVVPVYLYRCNMGSQGWADHDLARTMKDAKLDMQEFDLRGRVDSYSLPNLVATMRSNKYSLVDEIMGTALLTLDGVFRQNRDDD